MKNKRYEIVSKSENHKDNKKINKQIACCKMLYSSMVDFRAIFFHVFNENQATKPLRKAFMVFPIEREIAQIYFLFHKRPRKLFVLHLDGMILIRVVVCHHNITTDMAFEF